MVEEITKTEGGREKEQKRRKPNRAPETLQQLEKLEVPKDR